MNNIVEGDRIPMPPPDTSGGSGAVGTIAGEAGGLLSAALSGDPVGALKNLAIDKAKQLATAQLKKAFSQKVGPKPAKPPWAGLGKISSPGTASAGATGVSESSDHKAPQAGTQDSGGAKKPPASSSKKPVAPDNVLRRYGKLNEQVRDNLHRQDALREMLAKGEISQEAFDREMAGNKRETDEAQTGIEAIKSLYDLGPEDRVLPPIAPSHKHDGKADSALLQPADLPGLAYKVPQKGVSALLNYLLGKTAKEILREVVSGQSESEQEAELRAPRRPGDFIQRDYQAEAERASKEEEARRKPAPPFKPDGAPDAVPGPAPSSSSTRQSSVPPSTVPASPLPPPTSNAPSPSSPPANSQDPNSLPDGYPGPRSAL